MKILFICTAFNSLAQRMALVLREKSHAVTVEYALSPALMIEAAELAQPDLIICPFLTKHVPPKVYNTWLTLIVHPGPPGDAGPSAIDWCLIGDMGELGDADQELTLIDAKHSAKNARSTMRSHWGVTVLQAIEAFDAGPVWAFDQFELGASIAAMTKSDLYRGPVTRAAVNALLAAVERVTICAEQQAEKKGATSYLPISASVAAPSHFRTQCVSRGVPFLGGRTHNRPLLRASQRDFLTLLPQSSVDGFTFRLSADAILQRIRSADSQPGMLSTLFGTPLFLYNARIQRDALPPAVASRQAALNQPGTVLATRQGAVLVDVGADFPLWIGHLRRPKAKTDKLLQPKLPAVMALLSMPEVATKLGVMDANKVSEWSPTTGFGADETQPWARRLGTYQQVWVDVESSPKTNSIVAYVHADFYNGAFSTTQCEILLQAIQWSLKVPGLKAVVMLGGPGYFSNGIALNVIEGSPDPSAEGWANINAIDDCVQAILAPKGIVTFAAIRGNAAAGGLAMATAADYVICAESAVLNPHYRGLGLFGSECHTYSWYERCGSRVAAKFAREMLPMSSHEAKKLGLVDHVLENDGMSADLLLATIKGLVNQVMDADVSAATAGSCIAASGAPWTRSLRPAGADATNSTLLSEQVLRNKTRYLAYLFAENAADNNLPLEEHFQRYRKYELDQMTLDLFHPHRNGRFASRCSGFVRKLVPTSTPMRFALHRRYPHCTWSNSEDSSADLVNLDEEELNEFDRLSGIPASAAVARLPSRRPEFVVHDAAAAETRMNRVYSVGTDTLASCRPGEGSQRSSISTAPTTPRVDASAKPILSLGDEEAQRVEDEAEQLKKQRVAATGTTVKRGPTVISFVPAVTQEAKLEQGGIQARTERTTFPINARPAVVARHEEATDYAKKKGNSTQSKIQRFFQSLGRKSRANVQAVNETVKPASVSAPLAAALKSTEMPTATWPARCDESSTMDAATRARRRSSISDVFSMLENASRRSQRNNANATSTKAERRRSWRPTSWSGILSNSCSTDHSPEMLKSLQLSLINKSSGFQPDVNATPKIVEEAALTQVLTGKVNNEICGADGFSRESASGQGDGTNCLWSCYYSEDGVKNQG
ncbi:uncharacterized protein MEPE_02057 [Melanopsichium pennsylvanicum]|uniref:Formyl transferase C-terminal domain-containing protein n=2 Tax=Melanopsichium pennsylvanicum TaxID=63383 RepID=A0AAJ4XJJ3_9BASI|nr:formyl transferase domain-containing protein [Melanopsichium pennsylvanicum 4]SNX83350.1 uncharacterized protein MEPE_02057 [Melanopsichium pennsylvanicum]